MDDVTEAWKRTQERAQSARFEWTSQVWMREGSVTQAGVPPLNAEAAIPDRDVTFEHQRVMIFRDGLVRYENEGPTWHPDEKQFVKRRELYAWDGEEAIRFNGDRKKPYAFVHGVNQQLTQNEVAPIQFAFRMFHSDWYIFKADDYTITERNVRLGELNCLVIETSPRLVRQRVARGLQPLKTVWWVCPDRDFAIVHYAGVNEASGAMTGEFDLRHTYDDGAQIWIPSGWTITYHGNAGPLKIETSTVRKYELNPRVAEDTFSLKLPPDTMVTDLRTGEDYILRKDGKKRTVTREELLRGANYEDFVETETGQAAVRRSEGRGLFASPVTYIWIAGLMLLVVASVLAIRMRTA